MDLITENLTARVTIENLMMSQGLDLVSLRETTRQTVTSSTCIDSIYSNIPVQQSQIEKTTFSDHYTRKLELNFSHQIFEDHQSSDL